MIESASAQAIENLRKAFPSKDPQQHEQPRTENRLNVTAYLGKYRIGIKKEKRHGNSTLYVLDRCLFDESHAGGEAAIGQAADGKLFYKCFHNSCKDRDWHDARQIMSGNDLLAEFYPNARFPKTAAGNKSQPQCNQSVNLICAADIKPEPVSWEWEGYIARGKVHILAGPAGHGKTALLLALGATITIGGRWPDGSWAEVGDIAIWSGEDDPADTLVPRLISCGADRNRVHFINGVLANGEQRSFDPSIDMPLLREAIAKRNIKMLIIDPIVSAVGGDSHKNAETRRALQPVVDLAAEIDCAVYGVTHFTKGTVGRDPVERVTGSLAFGALTRLVTVAMKFPDDGNHPSGARLFARAKSNIGPDGGGFYYFLKVVEVPGHEGMFNTRVLWGDAVDGSARELIAKAEMLGDDKNITGDAVMWLQDVLSDGPVAAKEVLKAGKEMGYTKSTLHRAKNRLGITVAKMGYAAGWGWFLLEESTDDPTEGPIQLCVGPSGEKSTQVIDSVEDPTKVPHVQNMGDVGTFAGHEDPKGLGPSDGLLTDKGLGGVETTKIPCPTVMGPSGRDGTFDEDEVII